MTGRQYFRDALASGSFVVSNYLIGRLSGRPVLVTALPFGAGEGENTDVVFASVDIDLGSTTLRKTRLAAKGSPWC